MKRGRAIARSPSFNGQLSAPAPEERWSFAAQMLGHLSRIDMLRAERRLLPPAGRDDRSSAALVRPLQCLIERLVGLL